MSTAAMAVEAVARRIFVVRGLRALLDADLAALYGVPTKRFNEAVKRNAAKFPAEFMFQLTDGEFAALRSQIATSNAGRGGRRYLPHVFTEHGALMAATILNSPRAIEVSVYVVRAFVQLRDLLARNKELAQRLRQLEQRLERRLDAHDAAIADILAAIRPTGEPTSADQATDRLCHSVGEETHRLRCKHCSNPSTSSTRSTLAAVSTGIPAPIG